MKKTIFIFIALCFMGIALADVDFTEAINNSSMPTDAEIMQILSQFNFSDSQKEELFKETKKKLQQIYSGQDMAKTNAELNQYYNVVDSKELDPYMDSSLKQELKREVSKLPKTDASSTSSPAPSSARSVTSATYSQSERGFKSKKFESKKFESKKFESKGFQSRKSKSEE